MLARSESSAVSIDGARCDNLQKEIAGWRYKNAQKKNVLGAFARAGATGSHGRATGDLGRQGWAEGAASIEEGKYKAGVH